MVVLSACGNLTTSTIETDSAIQSTVITHAVAATLTVQGAVVSTPPSDTKSSEDSVAAPTATVIPTTELSPTPETLITEIPDAISPLCDNLGATSVYRNQEVGFELEYPAEWHILSGDYTSVLTSWELDKGGRGGSIPDGSTKVDIVVQFNAASLPEVVAQRRQQYENNEEGPLIILSEENWRLASGLQAVRWSVAFSGHEDAYEIITVINGYTVILGGHGDPDLFDAIACTMRLI